MGALTFIKRTERSNLSDDTIVVTQEFVNCKTKSPIPLKKHPIQGRISNGPSHGSMNLFFTTSPSDLWIYGITCAHVLPKIYENRKIKFRPSGSTLNSISGTLHLRDETKHLTDLSIVKFSKSEFSSSFCLETITFNHTEQLNLTNQEVPLYGIGTMEISGRAIETNTTLIHQDKVLNNLICFNQIGNKGDSGSSLFTYFNDELICLGQLCLISHQRTYITSFKETLRHLTKITNVHDFYYLTQNTLS